jgi:hypothetical protein
MNIVLNHKEFQSLPFRDDIEGDYIRGEFYRARAYPDLVFKWMGEVGFANWWAFGYRID